MSTKIKKDDNFLELIPFKNKDQKWELNDKGFVQITIPRGVASGKCGFTTLSAFSSLISIL